MRKARAFARCGGQTRRRAMSVCAALTGLVCAMGIAASAGAHGPAQMGGSDGVRAVTAAAATPLVSYLQVNRVVQPSKPSSYHGRCRGATPIAISGFLGAPNDAALRALALTASEPSGPGHAGWTVAVKDRASSPEPYFAGIICASATFHFAFKSTHAVLNPGRVGGAKVRCPGSASQPISGFVYQPDGHAGNLTLSESADAPGAWATLVQNVSDRQQHYVVGAVCVPRSHPVSYLRSKVLTMAAHALAGGNGRCSGSTPYAVAGVFGPPSTGPLGAITLVGTYPFGNGTGKPSGAETGRWTTVMLNLTGRPQPFLTGMVCLG